MMRHTTAKGAHDLELARTVDVEHTPPGIVDGMKKWILRPKDNKNAAFNDPNSRAKPQTKEDIALLASIERPSQNEGSDGVFGV